MKTYTVTMYQCEECGRKSEFECDIATHEPGCKASRAEYRRKCDEARANAIEQARTDDALRVLLNAGLTEEARERAQVIVYDLPYHPDSSCWTEAVLDEMVAVARLGA